jgi:hypothetical protein
MTSAQQALTPFEVHAVLRWHAPPMRQVQSCTSDLDVVKHTEAHRKPAPQLALSLGRGYHALSS